jgi:hypothetical protein
MSEKKISYSNILKKEKPVSDELVNNELVNNKLVNNEVIESSCESEYDYNSNFENDDNIKDADNEFEKEYNIAIIDIKFDFLKAVRSHMKYYCFFKNTYNISKYNFYDFIKNCSNNYYNIINKVDKDNDKYINLLIEKEKEEEENELENQDDYY